MNYRTEIHICVACGLKVHCRIALKNAKWKGTFRLAMSPGHCYRCQTIAALAREGEPLCQEKIGQCASYDVDAHIQSILSQQTLARSCPGSF